MIAALLAAELAILALAVVDGWVALPPFNDLERLRARGAVRRALDTVKQTWPVIAALVPTAYQLAREPAVVPAAVTTGLLAFGTASALTSTWIPWWFGAPPAAGIQTARTTVHAFLEPRGRGGLVPSTMHAFLHAQMWCCMVVSVVALLVGTAGD